MSDDVGSYAPYSSAVSRAPPNARLSPTRCNGTTHEEYQKPMCGGRDLATSMVTRPALRIFVRLRSS